MLKKKLKVDTTSVLFFNSSFLKAKKDLFEIQNYCPRIGIASMATYLLECGIDVKVVDPEPQGLNLDGIKKIIEATRPDIVGLPAYTEEVHDAAQVARAVKEVDPDIVTVVGGPHPSADPVHCLQEFNSFDIAVYGEGEATISDIAKGKPLEDILGIAFRKSDIVKLNQPRPLIKSLDTLPFPAWHLYKLDKYRGYPGIPWKKRGKELLEIPVEGARGCPFSCIFCFRVTGKTVRFKSPSRIADEIERDVQKFKANAIFFVEGTFGVSKKHAFALCDEILKRRLHEEIVWSTGTRVDTVDKELLEKMRKAGCVFIGFGVESGSPEILKLVGKNTKPEQIIEAFKICKSLGIGTEANFILGHPYDTEETILRTIEFSKIIEADNANFAILVPFPGTKVYEMASKGIGGLKIRTKNWAVYGKQIGEALELENLSRKRLIQLQTKAYREFYLRPNRLPRLIDKLTFKRIVYGVKRVISWM